MFDGKVLEGKVAIVTGSGRGIGEAVARAYGAQGAKVVVADMDLENAEKVAADIRKQGGQAMAAACNVAERAQVDQMAAEVKAKFGPVDILVNNAGITRTAMLHKMTPQQWNEVIGVHLTGSFNMLQAVVQGMIDRRQGWIINVVSTAGIVGTIGQINYGSAKGGLLGFTKSAAKELARYNSVVNAVAPGAATPMTETIRTDPRFKDTYLARVPLGRWAEPAELAPVFVFLASPGASYVTGQILGADGGLSIH
ncbi:MAG: 3-oxoacyl-ACP reductase FabG [Betaproteobacteria bacterium]|nr:3-oxoacyl-ACP reductase FabG [Betaproteobacteria bacterium]